MLCRVFCNLADSASVKTNQEIMMFTAKKNYTQAAIQAGKLSIYEWLTISTFGIWGTTRYSGQGISEKTRETEVI